jgi:hypothetical protein
MNTGRQVISITPAGRPKIKALFNPTEYTLAKANQIAEAAVPGLEAPIRQHTNAGYGSLFRYL